MRTVYREANRIRSTQGYGYGDMVSDSAIREHLAAAEDVDGERAAFGRAVLAIRAFERIANRATS